MTARGVYCKYLTTTVRTVTTKLEEERKTKEFQGLPRPRHRWERRARGRCGGGRARGAQSKNCFIHAAGLQLARVPEVSIGLCRCVVVPGGAQATTTPVFHPLAVQSAILYLPTHQPPNITRTEQYDRRVALPQAQPVTGGPAVARCRKRQRRTFGCSV